MPEEVECTRVEKTGFAEAWRPNVDLDSSFLLRIHPCFLPEIYAFFYSSSP
jgi:hypothetical protein